MNGFDLTRRPGLAYQHAFDWLAVQLHSANGRAACIASLPLQRAELAQRGLAQHVLPDWPAGDTDRFSVLAAVEPATAELPRLAQMLPALPPSGRVFLIVTGPLSRFLAEHRERAAAPDFAGERAVTAVLGHGGWQVVERVGLHGAAAVAWHLAGTAAGRLGRADWQDRLHYGMRRSFARAGGAAALVCLSAQRLEVGQ